MVSSTGNLLATKLYRPSPPLKRVPRPQLIQALNDGLLAGRRMTLVSAPAGFGKTTCISEWVDSLDGWQVSWLSLDPSDDDPRRFFSYLLAALQNLNADLGREIEDVSLSGQLPPTEVIVTTLCNQILELEGRFLLILDDFQAIQDDFILQFLEELVTNLPQPLHLVLLTREDPPLPLARLRANNQLTEIRAEDLRFSRQDTERFMREVAGLSLSPADISILEEKTEGWAVGLQLAGLSARDQADPSGFMAALSGSHRFILNYLTEEVISQQPQQVQQFLLETSILDTLDGDLCDAVTGRDDSRYLLDRLFLANLFLIPLDDEQKRYRYHHLFADLLQHLLADRLPDKIDDLHQRASRWYTERGRLSKAIQHALAAKEFPVAIELIESHAPEMLLQGYAKTVNSWVQMIPVEWHTRSQKTNLAFAWMHLLRGAYVQATPYLDSVEASLSGKGSGSERNLSIRAEWLAMRSLVFAKQGLLEASLAATIQALKSAPEADNRVRSLAHFCLASTYRMMEDFPQALAAYQQAIQLARLAENSVIEMLSVSGLAEMALEHGQIHLAFEIASAANARLERSGSSPPISAVLFGVLGEANYHWYQMDQARHDFLHASRLSSLGGYKSGNTVCHVNLSRFFQSLGDLETADRELQEAIGQMQEDAPEYVRVQVLAQQVRFYLAQGRVAAAQMALQDHGFFFQDRFTFPEDLLAQNMTHQVGLLYNSGLRFLLYQAQRGGDVESFQTGIALANRVISGALQHGYTQIGLEALLLRAQMRAGLGNREASQVDCLAAVELAQPEGYRTLFLEQGSSVVQDLADLVGQNQLGSDQIGFAKRILDAYQKYRESKSSYDRSPASDLRSKAGPPAMVEPLSEREMEVLRLMAAGLKYREIAQNLFISLNTVRSHVKAIYGKLQVSNRIKAIEAAKDSGIL